MRTPIGDLNRLYKQMHEPDENQLKPYDMFHGLYWIWVMENAVLKNLPNYLRKYVKEHARFDVFVNGQYIGPNDYIIEQYGKDILVKFKKSNFAYQLDVHDIIKMDGDYDLKIPPEKSNNMIVASPLKYLDNENDTPILQENGDKIFLI